MRRQPATIASAKVLWNRAAITGAGSAPGLFVRIFAAAALERISGALAGSLDQNLYLMASATVREPTE